MHELSTSARQVLDTLTDIGHGTVAEIRDKTGKSARVTEKAIRELADATLITETDSGDGSPVRWTLAASATEATDEPTDEPTDVVADVAEAADTDAAQNETIGLGAGDPADATDPDQLDQQNQPLDPDTGPADDTTQQNPADPDGRQNENKGGDDGSGEPAEESDGETEEVVARPKPPADRKVLAVAGVLGDYPDGATLDEIAEACGFNVGVVARLLQAMEQGAAARRIPADTEAGTPQRWQPGPGKASEVDPNPAPPRCPTCHQVIRANTPKTTAASRTATGTTGTVNSDGNEPLGRNILRGWVLEFINSHPGHVFTPQTIADALGVQHGREISSGAVRNNCTTLAAAGQLLLATESPLAFTANPPADSRTDSDTDRR